MHQRISPGTAMLTSKMIAGVLATGQSCRELEGCGAQAPGILSAWHSGPQIDALREAINLGARRVEITEAASACAAKRANEGH